MKIVKFITKKDVKLVNSKWDQDFLYFPLVLNIVDLSKYQVQDLILKFDEMGAVRIGDQPIFSDLKLLREIIEDFKSQAKDSFNKNIFFQLYFNSNNVLRFSINNVLPNDGGCAYYEIDTFFELANNLEASFPLNLEFQHKVG